MKRILLLLPLLFALISCSTGVVPPGTTVMITTTSGETETITSGKYTAMGRDRVYFLDTKLKSFTERMNILCKDKVNITVDVKWLGNFIADSEDQRKIIINKVPVTKISDNQFELSLEGFYNTAVKDIIKSNSRMVVSPYITDNVPEQREVIELEIKKRILKKLKSLKYPLATSDIMISNLDFDPIVTAQRQAIKKAELEDERKAAEAKATVAQATRDADIAREQGKAHIETARAKAKANNILSASITPNILAIKQWDVLSEAAKGPNNSTWVMPYEALKTGVITDISMSRK